MPYFRIDPYPWWPADPEWRFNERVSLSKNVCLLRKIEIESKEESGDKPTKMPRDPVLGFLGGSY